MFLLFCFLIFIFIFFFFSITIILFIINIFITNHPGFYFLYYIWLYLLSGNLVFKNIFSKCLFVVYLFYIIYDIALVFYLYFTMMSVYYCGLFLSLNLFVISVIVIPYLFYIVANTLLCSLVLISQVIFCSDLFIMTWFLPFVVGFFCLVMSVINNGSVLVPCQYYSWLPI